MYQIRTYNSLAQSGLDILKAQGYEYGEDIENPQAILLRSQDLHEVVFPDSLLGIFRAGSGVNNIPVEACTNQGIAVFNAPSANSNSVKELVIGAMITLARNIIPSLTWMGNLANDNAAENIEKNKKLFKGHEIAGKTLGVVGLGNIGARVAKDALALGMRVIGYDPYFNADLAGIHHRDFVRVENVDDLFKEADIITFHVPLVESTRNLANDARLALTKEGVILINFARNGIVDVAALAKYLENGHVKAFASDFYEESLVQYPNVFVTPHLGATTEEAQNNAVEMAAKSLVIYLESGEVVNSVNLPNMQLAFESPYRLAIINKNIPNMIAEISSKLGELHINIDKIANQARHEIAYTLVDISGDNLEGQLPGIIENLRAYDGIIRVRLIKHL